MGKTLAMILAGGKGKRMDILCHLRPKPALPFAGGFRVIDFSLSNCAHSDIKDIAILTDYQRAHMAVYLKQWEESNSHFDNFDILEPRRGSYAGTADAVYQNLDYLEQSEADTVLVLAGDHVYKMDYREIIDFHREKQADVTISVIPVPEEDATRFGTVKVDGESRITDFVEKSRRSESNLASMGIYVFNKKALMRRLAEDAEAPESQHDFGYSILPEMVKHDRVFAYRFDGYWQDIGTKDSYYAANMELIGAQPLFSLNTSWNVLSRKQELVYVMKRNPGIIQNSLISPGSVVKGQVENSILSPGVVVEEDALVRNSILMGNVHVGHYSVVENSILDEEVEVGPYSYIGFGSSLFAEHPSITIVGKGTEVPGHTAIGKQCVILPYTRPADFHGNMIPPGTTLSPNSKTLTA